MPLKIPENTKLCLLFTKCLRCVRGTGVILAVISLATVLTQDFHIFPLVWTSRVSRPPSDIEELSLLSADGSTVLAWRMRAKSSKPRAALILHGNGTTVAASHFMQRWMAERGITTYAMEYRGYSGGIGSPLPSERGLYEDAHVTFETMLREEHLDAQDTLVLGNSIGTGIASHIAARYRPGVLVLFSPYTSLPDVVRQRRFLGFFTPFLWYEFPTRENVARLRDTCVIAAHGHQDSVIPFHHSEELRNAYGGTKTFTLLESDEAGHNSIFNAVESRLQEALERCFSG